jgi:hypothetical protein
MATQQFITSQPGSDKVLESSFTTTCMFSNFDENIFIQFNGLFDCGNLKIFLLDFGPYNISYG